MGHIQWVTTLHWMYNYGHTGSHHLRVSRCANFYVSFCYSIMAEDRSTPVIMLSEQKPVENGEAIPLVVKNISSTWWSRCVLRYKTTNRFYFLPGNSKLLFLLVELHKLFNFGSSVKLSACMVWKQLHPLSVAGQKLWTQMLRIKKYNMSGLWNIESSTTQIRTLEKVSEISST